MRFMAVVLCAGLAASLLFAVNAEAGDGDPLERRMSRLEKELKLSDEQSTQVREILDGSMKIAEATRQELGDNPDALREALRENRDQTNLEIEAVLSEEQRETFQAFKKTGRADAQAERLGELLGLSADQYEAVHAILVESQEELSALRDRGGGGRGARGQLRGIMEDADKSIMAVLTEDQQETYEEYRDERREEMRNRMGSRGGMGGRGGGGRNRP